VVVSVAETSGQDPTGKVEGASNFGKLIADETEKWPNVVKFAGAKAE
jgi:hypothetical protein